MTKKSYKTPAIKVKAIDGESIMQASGTTNQITVDPTNTKTDTEWVPAKGNSVWEEE